jgi:site-specific DNA-cytosine methylase
MVTYLGGSILITIFALGGSIVSYNLQIGMYYCRRGIKQWGEEPLEVARLKDERLNPDWVEWLMGYPISWTEGGSRMQRLMALGNSVVPLIPEFLGQAVLDDCKQF